MPNFVCLSQCVRIKCKCLHNFRTSLIQYGIRMWSEFDYSLWVVSRGFLYKCSQWKLIQLHNNFILIIKVATHIFVINFKMAANVNVMPFPAFRHPCIIPILWYLENCDTIAVRRYTNNKSRQTDQNQCYHTDQISQRKYGEEKNVF